MKQYVARPVGNSYRIETYENGRFVSATPPVYTREQAQAEITRLERAEWVKAAKPVRR